MNVVYAVQNSEQKKSFPKTWKDIDREYSDVSRVTRILQMKVL